MVAFFKRNAGFGRCVLWHHPALVAGEPEATTNAEFNLQLGRSTEMNGARRFMTQPLMPMGCHIWLPHINLGIRLWREVLSGGGFAGAVLFNS
jgi:hypothetical protein